MKGLSCVLLCCLFAKPLEGIEGKVLFYFLFFAKTMGIERDKKGKVLFYFLFLF